MFDSLKKEHIVASDDFNRWKVPPASIAIHLCIGSVYAWSIFNPRLTKEFGVVAASANDWNLPSVVWIFSVAIVFLGLAAAFGGKWLEEVGPRMVGVVAAFCWGGGFIIGGLGIMQVRKRPARMGRNPATGEQIKIKASKKVAFRALKELKEAI